MRLKVHPPTAAERTAAAIRLLRNLPPAAEAGGVPAAAPHDHNAVGLRSVIRCSGGLASGPQWGRAPARQGARGRIANTAVLPVSRHTTRGEHTRAGVVTDDLAWRQLDLVERKRDFIYQIFWK